jgi:hypothetical protein
MPKGPTPTCLGQKAKLFFLEPCLKAKMHCILVYAEGPGGQYCSIQNFMLPSSFAIMGSLELD